MNSETGWDTEEVRIKIATVQYLETFDASSTLQQNPDFSRKEFAPVKIFSYEAIGSLTMCNFAFNALALSSVSLSTPACAFAISLKFGRRLSTCRQPCQKMGQSTFENFYKRPKIHESFETFANISTKSEWRLAWPSRARFANLLTLKGQVSSGDTLA